MRNRKTAFARTLRKRSTDAEHLVWMRLRARRLEGYKFKRQYPIGPYVVDFVCLKCRLVVELDGGQHAGKGSDAVRGAWLEREGFLVVRIWNNDVRTNLPGVLEHILTLLKQRQHPSNACPLPVPGEGQGEGSPE